MNRLAKVLVGLTALLVIGAASTVSAVVDPNPNRMSIYFDLEADVYEYTTAPYVTVPVYILLTNPSFAFLYGYEVGVDVEGNYMLAGTDLNGDGPITVGCLIIGDGCVVGLAGPLATSDATLIVTLRIFLMDSDPIRFTLHGTIPSTVGNPGVPAVLLDGDVILPTYPSVWDEVNGEPGVCAAINGTVLSADEATTWDGIKSIYR